MNTQRSDTAGRNAQRDSGTALARPGAISAQPASRRGERDERRGVPAGARTEPRKPDSVAGNAAVHNAARESNCMATVLLVDDDTNALCALKDLVSQEGYKVRTAANGALALRNAMAERPDVVVTDCMMPEMGGVDLSRAMQHERALADVPVVLVSALVTPPPDLHAAGFLRKPFAVSQLLAIIDRLVAA